MKNQELDINKLKRSALLQGTEVKRKLNLKSFINFCWVWFRYLLIVGLFLLLAGMAVPLGVVPALAIFTGSTLVVTIARGLALLIDSSNIHLQSDNKFLSACAKVINFALMGAHNHITDKKKIMKYVPDITKKEFEEITKKHSPSFISRVTGISCFRNIRISKQAKQLVGVKK